jgi:hypothetical protein
MQETAGQATDAFRRSTGEAMERMTETGERLVRSAGDYMGDLPDRAGSLFDDARESLTELFRSQPLAIGAVGIAIGAAVAAAIPATETEAEYFGESSDYFKQKASELAGEQVERATEIGKKVADAVVDEARQQGLTPDRLKSAASELSEKAARVAGAATERSSV